MIFRNVFFLGLLILQILNSCDDDIKINKVYVSFGKRIK
jgi:hypothetical protein